MKTIRLFFFLLASCTWFASAPVCAESVKSSEQNLVGLWEEYEPGSNVIQFFTDHTVRLYLTEEEGGESGSHWIEGTWSVSSGMVLTMKMSMNGESLTQKAKLVFSDEEMVLVDDSESETRHRRITGGLPAKYRW